MPENAMCDDEVLRLWADAIPGRDERQDEEVSEPAQAGGRRFLIKRQVSVPTLTVVRPAAGTANGTAVIVLPGGAFQVLAWDIEGTEAAHWLADRGVTAFILKYRVGSAAIVSEEELRDPASLRRALKPGRKVAVVDASQAVRVVRQKAARYGVKADCIGMLGFSAGGIAALGTVLEGDPTARPDFVASIYGMALIDRPQLPPDAAPLFVAHAQDDPFVPASEATGIMDLWTKSGRPAELHLYDRGGHGFGMRREGLPVDNWTDAFEAWLRSRGLLSYSVDGPQRAPREQHPALSRR